MSPCSTSKQLSLQCKLVGKCTVFCLCMLEHSAQGERFFVQGECDDAICESASRDWRSGVCTPIESLRLVQLVGDCAWLHPANYRVVKCSSMSEQASVILWGLSDIITKRLLCVL